VIKPLTESRIERRGIKPGTIAPDFTLPEIRGGTVSLSKYRERRILLVFSDPHCGPCTQLASYLVRAHRRRSTNEAAIVVVCRGDPGENLQKAQQQGFEFPVVVQDRWKLSRKYGIFTTPVAFLIGQEGRILRPVAVGVVQIRSLLYEEFPPGVSERVTDTASTISQIFSRPIPKRQALRAAGLMLASIALSAIGLPKAALALACQPGETPCGLECCSSSSVCCNGTCCEGGWGCCGGECCPSQLVCCNGTCCAPTEACVEGKCQQKVLP
jgi:peroxiredoxin